MKKAIIIIISVLVIALATCTCLYFFTDVFNFLKPSSDNFSIQAKKLFGSKEVLSYSDYIKSIESLKTKDESYTSDSNISFNLNLPSTMISSSNLKLLNNSSIKCTSSYNKDLQASSNKVSLSQNNEELFNLKTVVKGSIVDVQAPNLYDKPLRFDFDKYENYCQANNVNYDKNEIESTKKSLQDMNSTSSKNLLYDLLYLSEDEYNLLTNSSKKSLNEVLSKDKYSTKKNQEITIGEDDIKTTAYSLTVSFDDIMKYYDNFARTLKDDGSLKDLLVKKCNIINTYLKDLPATVNLNTPNGTIKNSELPDNISNSDLDKILDEIIDGLNKYKDSTEKIKDSIKITIYSDKKQNPVRMELAFVSDKEDDGTVFLTQNVEEGKDTYIIDLNAISKRLSNSTDSSDYNDSLYSNSSYLSSSYKSSLTNTLSKITIVDKYKKTDTSRNGTITISSKIEDEKQDLLTIDYENIHSNSEIKNSFNISSPLYSGLNAKFEFDIQGLNEDNKKMSLDITGKLPLGIYTMQVNLKADSSVTYGQSEVTEFTDAEDIFAKSGTELQAIIDKLFENASNNLPAKLSKFGIQLTKEQILALKYYFISPANATTLPAQPTDAELPAAI